MDFNNHIGFTPCPFAALAWLSHIQITAFGDVACSLQFHTTGPVCTRYRRANRRVTPTWHWGNRRYDNSRYDPCVFGSYWSCANSKLKPCGGISTDRIGGNHSKCCPLRRSCNVIGHRNCCNNMDHWLCNDFVSSRALAVLGKYKASYTEQTALKRFKCQCCK